MRSALVLFFLLSHLFFVFGQTTFIGTPEEKVLYNKILEAYNNYEFGIILKEEKDINEMLIIRKDTIAANALSFLAEAYFDRFDIEKSLELFEKELALRKDIQPEETNISLLDNLSYLYKEIGQIQKSLSLLEQVVLLDGEKYGKDSEEYFNSVIGLVDVQIFTKYDLNGGFENLMNLMSYAKNSYDKGIIYKYLGDYYDIIGSFGKSEKYLLKAIETFESAQFINSVEYLSSVNSLGILYTKTGQLVLAKEVLNTAYNIYTNLGEEYKDTESFILDNLAQVHLSLGDTYNGIFLQEKALKLTKTYFGENSLNYASSLVNLGVSFLKIKKYEESEQSYLEALNIIKKTLGSKNVEYGRILNNLSTLYERTGDYDKAIKYGKQSLQVFQKDLEQNSYENAFVYFNLANAYMSNENIKKTELFIEKSYKLRKKTLGTKHPQFAKNSVQYAILYWKKGDIHRAKKYYVEAFKNYFNQINAFFPILTEEEKVYFIDTNVEPVLDQYMSFIEQNHEKDKTLIVDAYDYQLGLKGVILYATNKVRESILSSEDETLINKYEFWHDIKEQLSQLFSINLISIEERNRQIDSLTLIANQLEKQLSVMSGAFKKNFLRNQYTWKDVQKYLRPKEASIEMVRYRYFVPKASGRLTEEIHYAALIIYHGSNKVPEMVVMRQGQEMEGKYLSNYRNGIKYQINETLSYHQFWKSMAEHLGGIEKIYFSPDGVYHQLNLNTLLNPNTKNYLIDEIKIQMVTNTRDLLESKEKFSTSESSFFGYPNYNLNNESDTKDEKDNDDGGDNRMLRNLTTESLRNTLILRGIRNNLISYIRSFHELKPLPGTKKEIELIDSLYQANHLETKVYLLDQAQENKIKSLRHPKILHIATHGFFLEQNTTDSIGETYDQNSLLRSGLILAGANRFILSGNLVNNNEDGILTAFEAMNLYLEGTEIVTLSACETGLGEIKNGEGVYGLQRAFKIAGAQSLIMSLWAVDDVATQELMTLFYQEWLSSKDKQTSFILAQKKLRNKYPNPFYWGAFVMIGN